MDRTMNKSVNSTMNKTTIQIFHIFPILLTFIMLMGGVTSAHANMASPTLQEGQTFATAYASQEIDVLSEQLTIDIDDDFRNAHYQVLYEIAIPAKIFEQSKSVDSAFVPLIFEVMDREHSNFSVSIDGQPVATKTVIDYMNNDINNDTNNDMTIDWSLFNLDDYQQSKPQQSKHPQSKPQSADGDSDFGSHLQYFQLDLSKLNNQNNSQTHRISVNYTAQAEILKFGWTGEYRFQYSLSPARGWKSFNELNIAIKVPKNASLTINLSNVADVKNANNAGVDTDTDTDTDRYVDGDGDGEGDKRILRWQFNNIPADYIDITIEPTANLLAQLMIKISPFGFFIISLLLGALAHLALVISVNNLSKWVRYLGYIIVPLIAVFVWIWSYGVIDWVIGDLATGYHGYIGLYIVVYPPLLVVYWLVMWMVFRLVEVLKGE